ncbi:MAG: cytochrome b [Roseiarcus sp.]
MKQASRYHPLLVGLHWALAALILGALGVGYFVLRTMPASDPDKVGVLRLHMIVGSLILLLMIVRFVVRLRTARPDPAITGGLQDRLAALSHYGFYVVVIAMVASGYATAILAGLPAIVFGGSGAPLPAHFGVYPPFRAHFWLAVLLAALIVLHTLAALYHQFVRRDRLFRRMWFGARA